MTAYGYRLGPRQFPIPAQKAGERLERVRTVNAGRLTAGAVVEDARPGTALLHPAFEWDDQRAAEKFREVQAGELIRSIVVVRPEREDDAEERHMRAFVHIREQRDGPAYVSIDVARNNPNMRAEVLARALAELQAFRIKYALLKAELRPLFDAVDDIARREAARESEPVNGG